jgi:hypothetical protein
VRSAWCYVLLERVRTKHSAPSTSTKNEKLSTSDFHPFI